MNTLENGGSGAAWRSLLCALQEGLRRAAVVLPTLLRRSCLARLPKTKSMASMTLDLPLPLGPTTEENLCHRQHSRSARAILVNSASAPEVSPMTSHAAALANARPEFSWCYPLP